MEQQRAFKNSLPLEPALTDMILNPKSEKIRRPPNAFMLFARDHRRLIAVQHPNVCNKTVSTMLGKVWKSTPENVKAKYYKKAKMLGELHKRQYPDYVYSPREARIQKMNKKKKNKEETNYVKSLQQNGELRADTTKTKDENLSEEGCVTAVDPDSISDPEYVPNNPGYFRQQSSDINSDDEQPPECVYPMYQSEPRDTLTKDYEDKNRRWQTSPGICRCCDRNKFGCQEKPIPPYQWPESERISPYYPDHLPCSYAPLCNSSGHFSRPVTPYCCSPPPRTSPGLRPYGPPFHPYWNLPTMNSSYCPSSREHVYESLKPFPTSYHTPDYFGHQFGYFDRHAAQFNRSYGYRFWPTFNEKEDLCRKEQNEHVYKNYESLPGYVNNGNNYSQSQVRKSTTDEEMAHHNQRIAKTRAENYEDSKNQNVGGCKTRVRESASPLSPGPVTVDEIFLKENHGESLSQKEKRDEISNNNFVYGEKFQRPAVDKIDSENEAIFADFCNFRAQVQPQESPNYPEFSECNKNQNKFRPEFQSEETSHSPRYSECNNDRNNFENMYAADVSPKLSKVSASSYSNNSSKMHSWSTPAMKSDFSDIINPEECNRSLTKMDAKSISGSLQNNIFTPNKLSTNILNTEARSNYNGRSPNDLENIVYIPNTTEMQCKGPNQMTDVYSDLRNYPTQVNQQISQKELMPKFPISFVKIESNSSDVFVGYSQNNFNSPSEVSFREKVDNKSMEKMEKARNFLSPQIYAEGDPLNNDNCNLADNAYDNSNISFNEQLNYRKHQLSTNIYQEDECNKKEKTNNLLRGNSIINKRSMPDLKTFSVNPSCTLKATYNALLDNNQVLDKNTAENDMVPLNQVIKIEKN